MQQPGFTSTPITKTLLTLLLTLSLLLSLTTTKPLLHLQLHPHLFPQQQFHRLLTFQLTYTNSGELFFGILLLYHLRLLERAFGSRKFLSSVLLLWAATSAVIPALLVATGGRWNYVPAGPTPVLWALLVAYREVVPAVYTFGVRIGEGEVGVSDKVWVYVVAGQLAAGQGVGSVLAAMVGWVVGWMWRVEVLPGGKWRVGRWAVVLMGGEREGGELEGLRRRVRVEVEGTGAGQAEERRSIVGRVLDTFRMG